MFLPSVLCTLALTQISEAAFPQVCMIFYCLPAERTQEFSFPLQSDEGSHSSHLSLLLTYLIRQNHFLDSSRVYPPHHQRKKDWTKEERIRWKKNPAKEILNQSPLTKHSGMKQWPSVNPPRQQRHSLSLSRSGRQTEAM